VKNILNLSILILLSFILFSCDEEVKENTVDVQIDFGVECGWCAGTEKIILTPYKMVYLKQIPCGENKGILQKEKPLSSDEWNQIVSTFDFEIFTTLAYSECNICVDGCDEILTITRQNKTHKISYTPNTEIKEIKDLQKLLSDLITGMREMN
jgi:hypothetical protein